MEKLSKRFTGYENSYFNETYERSNWIKATFDNKTKRFANPPRELDALRNFFKRRFSVLNEIIDMGYTAVVSYKPASNLPYQTIETSMDLLKAF